MIKKLLLFTAVVVMSVFSIFIAAPKTGFARPDAGGTTAAPAPVKPSTNTGDACKATDGTCADCQNSGAAQGCPVCANGTCGDPAADPEAKCTKGGCDIIKKYLNPTINLLSLTFGLMAVLSIILGGIQYSASEGDPQKTAKAKARISLTIFAVVAYFFLYAFLQFLVPGGIFNRTS